MQRIIDPVFLMEHDLTPTALLYDYYELQKYQWLAPEVRKQVDDAPIREYIDMMARKISLGMHVDDLPTQIYHASSIGWGGVT